MEAGFYFLNSCQNVKNTFKQPSKSPEVFPNVGDVTPYSFIAKLVSMLEARGQRSERFIVSVRFSSFLFQGGVELQPLEFIVKSEGDRRDRGSLEMNFGLI